MDQVWVQDQRRREAWRGWGFGVGAFVLAMLTVDGAIRSMGVRVEVEREVMSGVAFLAALIAAGVGWWVVQAGRRVRVAEEPAVERWWWTLPFVVLLCAGLIWWRALEVWQRVVVDGGIIGIALLNWWLNRRRRWAMRSLLVIGQGIGVLLLFHWVPRSVHYLEGWFVIGYGMVMLALYLMYGWDETDKWAARGLCLGCGYDIRGQGERCPECGRGIERRVACRGCGKEIYAVVMRCPECGMGREKEARGGMGVVGQG